MVVGPTESGLAIPMLLTVATAVDDDHVSVVVTPCVLLSLYVPSALNALGRGSRTEELPLIAIETSAGGNTVSKVEPVTPDTALMVVLPWVRVCASPVEFTVATEVAVDDQVAVPVRSCVELSVKVPVAVNCWLKPFATPGLLGVTLMETTMAGPIVSTVDALNAP